MINKLKKKIFWIIQISLSIIVLGVITIFTVFSYKNTISSSTMFMDRVEGRIENRTEGKDDKEEIKNDMSKGFNEPRNVEDPFVINVEGVYKFEINNNNAIVRESNGVTDELRNYAIEISNKTSEEGFIGNYIYKIRKFGNNGIEVTLMENENAIARLKTTILFAVIIGLILLILIYVIAKKIASLIVKPVEETFEKQKQFVSDASHELKTPLAVIEANADVLQDKSGENKWITYIQNEVQSMNKLVNDLLTLAKMEETKGNNYHKFDLSKEIQMSTAVFESMMFEKKIKLETNIQEKIEFNGDKEDIKHILSILLDNAIKHTNEEGKIVVNLEKEKNEIKIEVKNQGEPIPEEEREKIFERFYRVDKARSRSEKRYGLGLSIANEIVNKYKGTIKATSQDGYTSFVVTL